MNLIKFYVNFYHSQIIQLCDAKRLKEKSQSRNVKPEYNTSRREVEPADEILQEEKIELVYEILQRVKIYWLMITEQLLKSAFLNFIKFKLKETLQEVKIECSYENLQEVKI